MTWPCLCSPAAAQQRRRGCPAGRLRDPSSTAHPAQPGHPVRLTGALRGGRAALQAGPGGPGEDFRPRPPGRGHHAQHPGLGVQASSFHSVLFYLETIFLVNFLLKYIFINLYKLLYNLIILFSSNSQGLN